MSEPRRPPLQALDHAVYRVERWLAASLFVVMALLVFASVVQRTFSRPESRLMAFLGFGPDVSSETTLAVQLVTTFLVCFVAVITSKSSHPSGRTPITIAAALAALLTYGLVIAVVTVMSAFPNGIQWGPKVALAAMLWIGFLGASTATYERRHLAVEMGEKIWPKQALRFVRALAFLASAGMTAFLLYLSARSVHGHYKTWDHNPLAGVILATPIPEWAVFLIFPYTFAVMSLRFLGQAVASARGRLGDPEQAP